MKARQVSAVVLAVGSFSFLGCNLDRLDLASGGPDGPVTTPDRPVGVDASALIEDISIVDANEVDLVEEVLTHRANYHRSLHALCKYYESHGYATKRSWAEFELDGLKGVKPFRYIADSEVPASALRPTDRIRAADKMFERGLALLRKGGHGVPAVFRQRAMIEAVEIFRDIVIRHPSSDKIDDAAFYAGEIHKEYFKGQEEIAVKWYERAWTWDPNTPHPARFQAAITYDYRLHDRDRALELYHAVVNRETGDRSNVRFAMRRIHELTTNVPTAHASR